MFQDSVPYSTKFRCGDYKYPVTITKKGKHLWMAFRYNKGLIEEIRMMEGAKWHGYDDTPVKQWSVADTQRNRFQISYLEGKNPYSHYDKDLIPFTFRRTPAEFPNFIVMRHQPEMTSHLITRQYCELAADMGLGKTISVIEAMEWLLHNKGIRSWFYIAPKSTIPAVQLEFEKWRALIQPQFFTYDGLRSLIQNWPENVDPPQAVIFDEASRLKNPTSQRSQAALHLANNIRERWGDQGAVILMTGTPAPKAPTDWWSQIEIACPGFLREGSYEKLRKTLAVMAEGQNDSGQVFAKLVTWKDDEKKCAICGKLKEDPDHDEINMIEKWFHPFQSSVNEVHRLYKRMKGLVLVKFKKDVLDLPDKHYKIIQCKPSAEILRAAKLLAARSDTVIKTMTLLRELSDGFQYESQEVGTEVCPLCDGQRFRKDWEYVGPPEERDKVIEAQFNGQEVPQSYFEQVDKACHYCNGTGEVIKYLREAVQVPCPKEDALNDIIDAHDDVGRLVTYAGFTGSVDRCVEIYLRQKWDVIRVDGRGWWSNLPGDAKEFLRRFQYQQTQYPRLAFIGQPGAAGMGLTLTASPSIVYYSNDFNGESRTQSEDRIHRPGMDYNRGATIYDLIHLPTDMLVLENLRKKRKLETMSMGELKSAMADIER